MGVGTVEWNPGGPECLRAAGYRISRSGLEGWEQLFRLRNVDVMVPTLLTRGTLGGIGALEVRGLPGLLGFQSI